MSSTKYLNFFHKTKYFMMFITVLFVYIVALYSGPVVDEDKQIEYNARNVVVNNYIGFTVSSDTGNWMRLANNPKLLFENERVVKNRELTAGNVGQSKPGSFIIVFLISKPIDYFIEFLSLSSQKLFSNVRESLNTGYKSDGINQTVDDSVDNLEEFVSTYIAWIIFNILVIFLSFFLFCKSIGISMFRLSSYSYTGLWLGVFFIINDITKIYLISPNPGILNLLAVSLTIYSCHIIQCRSDLKTLFTFSFLFGFLNLFYEIFFAPYIVMIIFFIKEKILHEKISIFKFLFDLKYYLFSIFLFLIPYLFWIICLEIFFGGYFHFGVHDARAFNIFNLNFSAILYKIIKISWYGYSLALLSSFPLILILIYFLVYKILSGELISFNKDYIFIAISYTFIILLFFSLYGYTGTRHTIGTILVLLPFLHTITPLKIKNSKGNFVFYSAAFFLIYSIFVARKVFPFGEGILLNPFV